MPKNLSPGAVMLTTTLLLLVGCSDSPDERFRQLAQQTIHQQAAQNERMAKSLGRFSTTVIGSPEGQLVS